MIETEKDGPNSPMRKGVLGVLIATVVLATLVTSFGAYRYFNRVETQTANSRMELYLRTLNEAFRQHQHMPFLLAGDPRYLEGLSQLQNDPDINFRLAELAKQAKLEAVYLMDVEGVVQASSNAGLPNSFIGQNYGFRPYFQKALAGVRSDYFAIGATSGRPGYFVAEPITGGEGAANGVVAIKLDVSELQRFWESDADTVIALNQDNIIVLASNPDWLYRPITELDPATRQLIFESRQFGNEPLDVLDWNVKEGGRVSVDGVEYIAAMGQADWRDWSVYYLQPEAAVTRQTIVTTGLFGSIIALLVGFATFLRSRRIALAYEASVRQRAILTRTNRKLEEAQAELARSAKLSALGQLAASVTHELGQPISAFRNHLAAAEIGGEITSPSTANSLNKLVERMEDITKQFRYFARGRIDDKTSISLGDVIQEVANLLRADMDAARVELNVTPLAEPITVKANKILLEQALSNLLTNALHAVQDEPKPQINLSAVRTGEDVELRVTDNGPGVGGVSIAELQEPFFSTKPSGIGMGLGLSITTEIIKDHGGELSIGPLTEGAEFIIRLPIVAAGELI